MLLQLVTFNTHPLQVESSNKALCAPGRDWQTGLQIHFQELSSTFSLHTYKNTENLMVTAVPVTSKSFTTLTKLEKYVLNCMRPLTKISFVLTCFFGAVPWAAALILPQIQLHSVPQLSLCHPRTAARQAFLSITNSESLLKLMSIQWMIKLNSPFVHVFKNPECGLHLQVDAYVVPCGKIPWYCELFTLSGAYPVSQSK